MSYGYIYLIKDHFTNKVYIGQRKCLSSKDEQNYFGSGKIIQRVVKKRKCHLSKIILRFCETKEELDEAEKECIKFFDARNPIYGYNIAKGGEGGDTLSKHPNLENIKKNFKNRRRPITKIQNFGSSNGRFKIVDESIKDELVYLYEKENYTIVELRNKFSFGNGVIARIFNERSVVKRKHFGEGHQTLQKSKDKNRQSHLGKIVSNETRERMSESHKNSKRKHQ